MSAAPTTVVGVKGSTTDKGDACSPWTTTLGSPGAVVSETLESAPAADAADAYTGANSAQKTAVDALAAVARDTVAALRRCLKSHFITDHSAPGEWNNRSDGAQRRLGCHVQPRTAQGAATAAHDGYRLRPSREDRAGGEREGEAGLSAVE
jgi:hypothetical protein